jgi:hypothetical protein
MIDWNPILKAKLIKQLRLILPLSTHHCRRPPIPSHQTESRPTPTFKPTSSTKSADTSRSNAGRRTGQIDPKRAESERKRPVIPTQGGHRFRVKADSDSD